MSDFETRYAIREVLEAYSGAAGRLDIEEYMTFFVPDAQMHGILELFGGTGPLVGLEAIRGFFGPALQGLDWLIQNNSITNIDVAPDGKTATASLGLTETAGRGDDMTVLYARYDDKLVLTDKGWKFAERRLTRYKFTPPANPAVSV